MDNTLEVFPLYNQGVLYGAIQNGVHEFYIKEANKESRLTSTAKFSHVWLKENDAWLLKRVLSYDHKTPNKPTNNKKEIMLSEAVLESYVGRYEGQHTKANLTRKENTLLMGLWRYATYYYS